MRRIVILLAILVAGAAAAPASAAIQVAIVNPSDGAHSLSGVVPVEIDASADSGIYGVQLYVDGQPYGLPNTTPSGPYRYTIAWDAAGASVGTHTLAAKAIDWSQLAGGASQMSAPISVDVGPAYPTVSLLAPPSWTLVRGTVQISASVTSVGSTSTAFTVDGKSIGTASAPPWSASWDSKSSSDGTHVVAATVTDGRGKQASAATSVTVDNTAPNVYLTAPQANSWATGTLAVSAHASDAYGTASVQFAVDGKPVGQPVTQPGAPYTYSATLDLSSLAAGTAHQLTVLATDSAGNATTSQAVSFSIGNPPPVVAIAQPLDGAFARGVVPVTATVTAGTAPFRVSYAVDGKAVGTTLTAPPYQLQWDTTKVTAGSHTLTATVTDAQSRSTGSAVVRQTVDNAPPSAVLYQPAPNARVDGPITLQAHASDAFGVRSVRFSVDGNPVGSLLATNPAQPFLYSIVFDTRTLTAGTHAVSALVTDNAGNTATAPPVSIKTGPLQYLPVLNYHEIDAPDGNDVYDQTLAQADQELAYLKAQGYQSVTVEQYRTWLAGGSIGIAKPVLITVDDGFKTQLAWDGLLKKYGFKAVVYVVTGYADNKTPGDQDANNLTWSEIKALAATGRWQIAFHAGAYGHGSSYDSGAVIDNGSTRLSFTAACPYYYTCLGRITTGSGRFATTRTETFAEYKQRVTSEVTTGMADLKRQVPSASMISWAAPFNDAGQWTNLYNDPSGQAQAWFPGFMASKFPLVMIQTNPVTYGQASGTVGSLTGFNRHYRFEVHTDTTIAQLATALTDPAFAR